MNALLFLFALSPAQPPAPAPLEKAWYSPHELLPALAARDGIRWALPEALAGRAWVGGDVTYKAALEACQQWKLNWTESNGVVVVHREHPKFKEWTAALAKGDTEAAWELGWSRDARAIPPLAEALASKQPAVSPARRKARYAAHRDSARSRGARVSALEGP